jgi:O-antigen biosynthesis protein
MKIPPSPRLYRPTKVTEVELTEPFGDLTVSEGYQSVKVLVRFHRVPIGYVSPPITSGRCRARSIITAALEQHSWRIVCHLLRMALATPQFRAGLTSADLPKIVPPPFQGPFPLVTVIVCTRDRTDELGRCINSLLKLDYSNLELLVVDNAPRTNATEQLLRSQYPSMRYVREMTPGLNHARNRGIAEAKGDVLAFTDDDVVVDPGWVTALAKLFVESPEVMAVTGLVVPFELETEPQALFELQGGFGRGFDRKWYQVEPGNSNRSESHHGAGKFGTGANMAFRKILFSHIGAFDPALDVGTVTCGGGDIDMFFRVIQEGYILVYEPAALVHHRHRRDYAGLRKQIEGNGLGLSSFHVRNSRAYPLGEARLRAALALVADDASY